MLNGSSQRKFRLLLWRSRYREAALQAMRKAGMHEGAIDVWKWHRNAMDQPPHIPTMSFIRQILKERMIKRPIQ